MGRTYQLKTIIKVREYEEVFDNYTIDITSRM